MSRTAHLAKGEAGMTVTLENVLEPTGETNTLDFEIASFTDLEHDGETWFVLLDEDGQGRLMLSREEFLDVCGSAVGGRQ